MGKIFIGRAPKKAGWNAEMILAASEFIAQGSHYTEKHLHPGVIWEIEYHSTRSLLYNTIDYDYLDQDIELNEHIFSQIITYLENPYEKDKEEALKIIEYLERIREEYRENRKDTHFFIYIDTN